MVGISQCPGLYFNSNTSRNPVCAKSPSLLGWALLFSCFAQISHLPTGVWTLSHPYTAGLLPCLSSSAVLPEHGWLPCLGGAGQQRCGMVIAELTANDRHRLVQRWVVCFGNCIGEPGYLLTFLLPTFQCLFTGWGLFIITLSRATRGDKKEWKGKGAGTQRRGGKTDKGNRQKYDI